MSLPVTRVVAQFYDQSGSAAGTLDVKAVLTRAERDGGVVVPREYRATTDESGLLLIDLWPNARGTNASQYRVTAKNADGALLFDGRATVPESEEDVDLIDILTDPLPSKDAAVLAVEAAQAARDKANEWAENAEDDPVEDGEFSALHHAAKAEGYADAAAASALAAAGSAAAALALTQPIVSTGFDLAPTIRGLTTAGSPAYASRFASWQRTGGRVDVTIGMTLSAITSIAGSIELRFTPPPGLFPDPRRARYVGATAYAEVKDVDGVTQLVVPLIVPALGDIWGAKLYKVVSNGALVPLTHADLEATSVIEVSLSVPALDFGQVLGAFAHEATIIVDIAGGTSDMTIVAGDAAEIENQGLAGNFTQSTASLRPTVAADGFGNGRPAILANGADYMTAPDFAESNYTSRTAIVLFKTAETVTSGGIALSHGNRAATSQMAWHLDPHNSSGYPSARVSWDGNTTGGSAHRMTSSVAVSTETSHVAGFKWSGSMEGGAIRLMLDGTQDPAPVVTPTGAASMPTVYNSPNGYGLLASFSGNDQVQAGLSLGAAFMIARELNATEERIVHAALLYAGGIG